MSQTTKVRPIEISLNSIWMLQPEYKGIRRSLENKGYTLREQTRGILVVIASKGSIEIFVNPERRVLGIGSETSSKDLLVAYEDLDQAFLEVGMEPSNLMFVEFVGTFMVESVSSPLGELCKLKFENDLLAKIGVVLEKELATIGLSLALKGANPTESNWLHLFIEPLYPSANKNYKVRVICRGNKDEVVNFVKTIEKRIPKIIDKIEGT
ncbi:MAG TPA: hypothetical protein VI864_04285 [Candidatus Bathyarchaeia archaeon]|nr:hypothetical protein [Candidatus Bathyarchaeia archaeon]